MKFRVTMKDPDGVYESIREQAMKSLEHTVVPLPTGRTKAALCEVLAGEMKEFISRWVEYGEYVSIEFDTDAGTAVVVVTDRR